MQFGEGVEQLDGERGDVGRVGRIVVAALGELPDAAARHVAQVVHVGPAVPPPADRVEQHALAERASLNVNDSTPNVGDRLEDQRPGDDDVGAVGLEAGHLPPRRGPVLDTARDHVVAARRRELEAVVGAQRLGARHRMGDAGDRLGGARRRHGDVEAVLVDLAVEVAR